jgi:hypothetical protein
MPPPDEDELAAVDEDALDDDAEDEDALDEDDDALDDDDALPLLLDVAPPMPPW